jgi:adenosylcobinamide kinase/adenosylcobinamide-phosphate guanylyltransferase
MAEHSPILFITGGVRSGKSRFAEETAAHVWKASPKSKLHYIAAMQPSDMEMRKRISRHQEDRINSELDWQTWEKPSKILELAPHFTKRDIVLLDCLTTWLNNELFFQEDVWQDEMFQEGLLEEMWTGIHCLSKVIGTFIIVSNEVLHEPVGSNNLVYAYKKILGRLHQRIVENARGAFLVEAGIPILMKGEIGCVV